MPTPLDRALNSKNLLLSFAALVTAATAWSIWGPDIFAPADAGATDRRRRAAAVGEGGHDDDDGDGDTRAASGTDRGEPERS